MCYFRCQWDFTLALCCIDTSVNINMTIQSKWQRINTLLMSEDFILLKPSNKMSCHIAVWCCFVSPSVSFALCFLFAPVKLQLHLLIAVCLMQYIPMPVLYGVFLYMGVASLSGIQVDLRRLSVSMKKMSYITYYILHERLIHCTTEHIYVPLTPWKCPVSLYFG